jgi:hypothetical protein
MADVIIEPFQVLVLDCGNALQNLVGVKHRLGGCEQVGGSDGRLAINEGQGIGSYAKPLEVRSGQLQVQFIAIAA